MGACSFCSFVSIPAVSQFASEDTMNPEEWRYPNHASFDHTMKSEDPGSGGLLAYNICIIQSWFSESGTEWISQRFSPLSFSPKRVRFPFCLHTEQRRISNFRRDAPTLLANAMQDQALLGGLLGVWRSFCTISPSSAHDSCNNLQRIPRALGMVDLREETMWVQTTAVEGSPCSSMLLFQGFFETDVISIALPSPTQPEFS